VLLRKANYQSAYFWAASSAKQGNQEGKKILAYISKYKQLKTHDNR
jgi:hypothetical protein